MGKKYIIELEEPEMFDDRKFYTCSQMPWWAVSENIVENLTPYTEPDTNEVYQRGVEDGAKSVENWNEQEKKLRMDEAYQRGLNDAWLFAEHLAYISDDVTNSVYMSMNGGKGLLVAFGMSYEDAKKQYDEYFKKKQEQEQIQVGDEVKCIKANWTAIVTKIKEESLTLIDANGAVANGYNQDDFVKTGRHFPEIAAVLAEMKGEP